MRTWNVILEQQEKRHGLKLGIAAVLGGLILAGIILSGLLDGTIWWLGVAGAIFGGAFAIWEARVGWCIVRAIGFKTPL